MTNKLNQSLVFRWFRKTLAARFGESRAARIWSNANAYLTSLK